MDLSDIVLYQAVNQLRELMSSEGGTAKKKEPETLTELSASGYDSEYKWSAAEIARLVEKSRELSGSILKAVQEAQRLAELRRVSDITLSGDSIARGKGFNFSCSLWEDNIYRIFCLIEYVTCQFRDMRYC